MGGSSGGFFYKRSDPSEIIKKIQEEKEKNSDAEFDSEVNKIITELLSQFNRRDQDLIQQRLSAIFDSLEMDVDGTIDLRYGGSVSKHTYVDGLSDIDALAIINNTELATKSPAEIKQYFFQKIKQRYPDTKINEGTLTVTVKFSDGMELQILPALRLGQGIKIASSRQPNNWSTVINPEKFAKVLRLSNQSMKGKLVPVIKLAKSIISGLPENRRVSGYHVEALAIELSANYSGENNTKSILKHFFSSASNRVLSPIKDNTGQSTHVDGYLGGSHSLPRKMISDSFASISRKMDSADGSKSLRYWKELLNS